MTSERYEPARLRDRLALMVITGEPGDADPRSIASAALRGGATAIQLRWKDASTRELLELAREFREITTAAGSLLIINDRVDVALVSGADGAHLGDEDLPLSAARRMVPGGFVLGRSVDVLEEARDAEEMGADYIGLGPIFPTATKNDTGPVLGIGGIPAIRAEVRLPIVAIGGIHIGTVAEVVNAGADGIAVIRSVAAAADPEATTRSLRERIREGLRLRQAG